MVGVYLAVKEQSKRMRLLKIWEILNQETDEENPNIKLYTDYRTYLNFDLKVKHPGSIEGQRLSKTLFTKSGGENQTPFYIAIVASFAQLYHVYLTRILIIFAISIN